MAWTTPRNWTTGELVSSTIMNTHVRDNLNIIHPQYGNTLPASPANEQKAILVDSATNPSFSWSLHYNSTIDKWEYIGGRPLFSQVGTAESTSSTTYTALTTAGPSVTLPVAGTYEVATGCYVAYVSGVFNLTYMSYDIGGTGAADGDAVKIYTAGSGTSSSCRFQVKTLTAVTLTMKYRTATGSSITASWADRWMRVTPVTL